MNSSETKSHAKPYKSILLIIFLFILLLNLSCEKKDEKLITESTGLIFNIYFTNFSLHIYIDDKDIEDINEELNELRSFGILIFNYSSEPNCKGTYYYEFKQGAHYFCKSNRCKKIIEHMIDFEDLITDLIKFYVKNNNIIPERLIDNKEFKQIIKKYFRYGVIKKINTNEFDFDNYVNIIYSNDVCYDYALQYLKHFLHE